MQAILGLWFLFCSWVWIGFGLDRTVLGLDGTWVRSGLGLGDGSQRARLAGQV